ncbi:hypothetical protein K438DRAFT_1838319 [Mycena galopus ATCC 62051]|nr:hypothetical protein K438DRAFT_1838319 [Mycena galopus ATCC 62051]
MARVLAKAAVSKAATHAGLELPSFIGGGRHISITCDEWYTYSGEEHNYDSGQLPDLV